MVVKQYLQFTRAHTVPLEAVPAIVGALIATEGQITNKVILVGIFGVLYHLTGYGMNSYSDWSLGYDKEDPNKSHHPLNKGSMSKESARRLVMYLFLVTLVWGIVTVEGDVLAYGALVSMVMGGLAYNYLGKMTTLKFIPISIAHTMVFVYGYLVLGGDLFRPWFLVLTFAVFLWIVFQISVSGELKDIMQDEANFMKRLGVKIEENRRINIGVKAAGYSMVIKSIGVLLLFLYAAHKGDLIHIAIMMILLIASMAVVKIMIMEQIGVYNREKTIALMSSIEGITLVSFVYSTSPVIGLDIATWICIASISWVVIFNMIQWNSIIAPKV